MSDHKIITQGKHTRSVFLLLTMVLLLALCVVHTAYGQDATQSLEEIVLENRVVRKIIHCSEAEPAGIRVASLYRKANNEELLAQGASSPWFEFAIEGKLVRSTDPLWQCQGQEMRDLPNGGTETLLTFEGQKDPVEGLRVEVRQQLFPESPLIRERLTLRAKEDQSFALSKLDGELHFVFPQYALRRPERPVAVRSTEIRVATWGGEVLDSLNASSYDDRRFDGAAYQNLAQAHMFHPSVTDRKLRVGDSVELKGPFGMLSMGGGTSFLMAYEHASQDNLASPEVVDATHEQTASAASSVLDEQQGVTGYDEEVELLNRMLRFLEIRQTYREETLLSTVQAHRGAYLDGEEITASDPYTSVWTATGFFGSEDADQPRRLLHNYLLKWIYQNPVPREPTFYYNTWGMQRWASMQGKPKRGVLTYDRIFEEIRYAAQLGVDLFVLDDGWEAAQGVWRPHPKRLSEGLGPIADSVAAYGMELGVWLSPVGIDSTAERFKEHPEWVIRNGEGDPIEAQWGLPAFDFVSGFYKRFVEDCKRLIDQGVRFFKWDALNTFYPADTQALHGSTGEHSREAVIARYGYMYPRFVKRAMAELKAYNPDVDIEIDVTEARRALPGLAMLSKGKFFWMNNGASSYGDHSTYRAKSMRTVANEYAGLIPLQLFTYANYPHNTGPFYAQRYNVNTSLVAGRGFWGDLSRMTEKQRRRVSKRVRKSKRVLPYVENAMTKVKGKVGASPEIYTLINAEASAGQVIAFSGSATNYRHEVTLEGEGVLGVLNNSYALEGDTLALPFQFPTPDASREAFVVPNEESDITITKSTSWLDDMELTEEGLMFVAGAAGEHQVQWSTDWGEPRIESNKRVSSEVQKMDDETYTLSITTFEDDTTIRIGFVE